MSTDRLRPLRWTTWLAAWVILLSGLMPSVNHWMTQAQARNALPGATICSSGAHKAKGAKPEANQASGHCPFCLPHDGNLGLPPTAMRGVTPTALAQAEPFLFLQSPRPLFAWGAAQPRGPPAA